MRSIRLGGGCVHMGESGVNHGVLGLRCVRMRVWHGDDGTTFHLPILQ